MRALSSALLALLILPTHAPPGGSRPPAAIPAADHAASATFAGFRVKFNDHVSPYRVMAVFTMPRERVDLEIVDARRGRRFRVEATAGPVTAREARRWRWESPEGQGVYRIRILQLDPPDTMTLNAFVMVPFGRVRNGYLNGYRIGEYPSTPLKHLPIYRRPRGFVEVTPENRATLVSPHFRLGDFLCKQSAGWPRYLVLHERLLLKLELVLQRTNEAGYDATSFRILSGYRTPYYNHLIGNVRYSRHIFGDAADIYIDERPPDGMMDDLDRNGHIDYRDAGVLYDLIDHLYAESWYTPFVGGLGRYQKTRSHGPFVHVDTRGFRARWGT